MPLRRLALLLAGGVLSISLILPWAPRRVAALAAHASAGSAAPRTQSAPPLPGGCGHVTPPGEPVAPCCLSGFIFMDGQIIAGAEVVVQSSRGDQVTLFTQVYSGTETRPYYRLSLSAAPLNIQAGEAITI